MLWLPRSTVEARNGREEERVLRDRTTIECLQSREHSRKNMCRADTSNAEVREGWAVVIENVVSRRAPYILSLQPRCSP